MTEQPVTTPIDTDTETPQRPHPLVRAASLFLTIALPFLLVMLNVRLVMTPLFLHIEYTRPGFPDDPYGFTREDRLHYAPYAVDYLLNDASITFLGDLTFSDGAQLFNDRELRHMRDVKVLTQAAFMVAGITALLTLLAAYGLWRQGRLQGALWRGGMLTIGLIITIIVVAVLNWNFFFTGFHTLFFESDTWYFRYSDTLIRLFPEQFWFDAALVIGVLTTLQALLAMFTGMRWRKSTF